MKVTNRPAGGVRIVDRVGALFDQRFSNAPAWVALLELFLGMGWLRASAEKVVDRQWWNGAELESFVAEHQSVTLDWYEPFLTYIVLPNSVIFAAVVFGAEVVAGVAFIVARPRWLGPVVSVVLAMNFLAAGSPNPSVFYLMLTLALGLWWLEERADADRAALSFRAISLSSIVILGFSSLSITTLEPSRMVEDPALVMCSFVGCAFVAALIGQRGLRASVVDAREYEPEVDYEIIDLGESRSSDSSSSKRQPVGVRLATSKARLSEG